MSTRKRILLIGAIGEGHPPQNGEEYKNQVLLEYLRRGHAVVTVDTRKWKRDPPAMISLLYNMLIPAYDRIIVSASSASVYRLFKLLSPFRSRMRRTVYFVIGGYFAKGIEERRYTTAPYEGLSSVVVEGDSMREDLVRLGLKSKVHVVPNFKRVDRLHGDGSRYDDTDTRFIFLSRISEGKGVLKIFEAVRSDMMKPYRGAFSIDFYGPMEEGFREAFYKGLDSCPECRLMGYLDVAGDRDAAYATISGYHAMLFPTFWVGEGFPGVIVDAFACGLPVIATRWNMNAEVVTDGITGRLVDVNDSDSLAKAMVDVIGNKESWRRMSANCHGRATGFDTDNVLDRHLRKII